MAPDNALQNAIRQWLQRERSATVRYAFGVLLALVAAAIRYTLEPMVGPNGPYLPFLVAIIAAACFGGHGPGLLTTVTSALICRYLFLEPRFSFAISTPAAMGSLVLFVVIGAIVSFLLNELRQTLVANVVEERRYRDLFESRDEGFASAEMIYDEAGQAVDFRCLAVNPAFAEQTGLPLDRVVGRTARQLIPDIEPFWIKTDGRVVRTGRS